MDVEGLQENKGCVGIPQTAVGANDMDMGCRWDLGT